MLVVGARGMEAGAVSVCFRHDVPPGAKPKAEIVADVLASIKDAKRIAGKESLSVRLGGSLLTCSASIIWR